MWQVILAPRFGRGLSLVPIGAGALPPLDLLDGSYAILQPCCQLTGSELRYKIKLYWWRMMVIATK